MSRSARRWWSSAAAIVAVSYLVVMLVNGALPRSRQVVEFEAKGVLAVLPERVERVKLVAGSAQFSFERRGQEWVSGGDARPLAKQHASILERAVKFMHTSAPVRVFPVTQTTGGSNPAFGLDPPRYAITLSDAKQALLEAQFGGMNTDGFLQYMQVVGRDELFLMSRFVGAEWGAVAAGMTQ